MALTGSTSLAFTDYDTLKFSWSATQSVAENASTVSWKLELISGKYGEIISSGTKAYTIVVDGNTYTGSASIAIGNNATKTLASGTTKVKHDASGKKTFNYSFTQTIKIYFNDVYIGTKGSSGSGVLDDIPRYATLVNAPNFVHTSVPQIQYSNPAGSAIEDLKVCISLTESDASPVVPYQAVPETGTYFLMSISTTARKGLAEAMSGTNSVPIYYILSSTLNGSTEKSILKRTYTVENVKPNINYSIIDSNTTTSALTGNTSKFIKFYSTLQYTFSPSGNHYATIVSKSVNYQGTTSTDSQGTFNSVESNNITFSATDSRGVTDTKTVELDIIDYIKPSCNLTAENPTAAGTMALKITGNYFNGSFGATSNSISVQYHIKEEGGSYGGWSTVSGAYVNGNAYECTTNVTGLDYQKSYTVEARITDKLNTVTSKEVTVRSIPTFDWGKNDFNLNVELKLNGDTVLRATEEKKVVLSAEGSDIYLRPNGSTTDEGQLRLTASGIAYLDGVQIATIADIPVISTPADYVIEQGNNGSYGYRKWNSGKMEAWRTATSSVTATVDSALYGQMYYTSSSQTLSTTGNASQFKTIEDVQLTILTSTGMAYPVIRSTAVSNGAASITYYVANPLKTNITVTPKVRFIGTWK